MTRSKSCAKPSRAVTSKLEQKFLAELALLLHGVELEIAPEYRFHPVRRWRFDIAFPEILVAVEINGGLFSGARTTKGRHSRGAGQLQDYEKMNAAIVLGWRVFQYGPVHVRDSIAQVQVADFVRQQLQRQPQPASASAS